ncbi:MAG: helix-turn-helix transcriptional regulator [Lachnospiraceae bacterium]|nr:helix-turn-helix transcriptional regulator [Lachnospiraceae bacterium]
MTSTTKLVKAHSFFDNENQEMCHELNKSNMLVDIASEFIKYRAEHNLKQQDLAEKLGVTQAMVSKLESGDYNPTVTFLYDIAQKMDWTFNIVFSCEPAREKQKKSKIKQA